jgi:hypothetical protein
VSLCTVAASASGLDPILTASVEEATVVAGNHCVCLSLWHVDQIQCRRSNAQQRNLVYSHSFSFHDVFARIHVKMLENGSKMVKIDRPVRDQLHLQQVSDIKGVLNKQEQHGLKDLPATTATRADYKRVGAMACTKLALDCKSQNVHVQAMLTRPHAGNDHQRDSDAQQSGASYLTLLPKTKVSASTVAEKVEKPFTLQHKAAPQVARQTAA